MNQPEPQEDNPNIFSSIFNQFLTSSLPQQLHQDQPPEVAVSQASQEPQPGLVQDQQPQEHPQDQDLQPNVDAYSKFFIKEDLNMD
jgi:hypothetical protein